MLDICLLGTGGMMPLPYRYLTSMMARFNGNNLLIDCGEGTQMALRKKGWSCNPVDVICFTHYHGDHIGGLPGLLLTMGNAERRDPLVLIGPKGLERVVNSLRVIAPELPFSIIYEEITEPQASFDIKGYHIEAFRVQHNVTCYGYTITIPRAGKFDAARAKELQVPLKCWNPLQKGETVTLDGVTYTPDMVMGAARRGLKVTYVTDTRPIPLIAEMAQDSDLFICEGMYGDMEKLGRVKEHRHMMMQEAANLAAQAQVKELWLTHYSPACIHPEEYAQELKEIFPQVVIPRDGRSTELKFAEE